MNHTEDLAQDLARRAGIMRARDQQVRAVVITDETGRYVPALILDASASNRKWAERVAADLNRSLVPLILAELDAMDARNGATR